MYVEQIKLSAPPLTKNINSALINKSTLNITNVKTGENKNMNLGKCLWCSNFSPCSHYVTLNWFISIVYDGRKHTIYDIDSVGTFSVFSFFHLFAMPGVLRSDLCIKTTKLLYLQYLRMLLLHNILVNQNADTNLHFLCFHLIARMLSLWLSGPVNKWKRR